MNDRLKSERRRFFSQDDIARYRTDGFVFVRGMYSAASIRAIADSIRALAAAEPRRGEQMVYYEDSLLNPGKRVLSRIERFVGYHEGLTRLVLGEDMTGRAGELLGEEAVLFKEKINFKEPGGSGFTPHQDVQAGWKTYAHTFVSVLITIDESTEENGCIEIASGHHTKGLIGKEWAPLEGPELRNVDFVKYPTSPGDVVFFDGYTPHQSKANVSDTPRCNIYLTLNPASQGDHRETYFADKRKNYPPDNEREAGKEYVFRV